MKQSPTALPKREMKVLALGLPRTGTLSMANALTILGYKNVYHTLHALGDQHADRVMSQAADATFPSLPTYTGEPFTLDQWDDIFGSSEAVTEAAALYGPQLVDVYPDAKVVLVIRDFDKWEASIDDICITPLWSLQAGFFVHVVQPILGLETVKVMRKTILGFFEATTIAEAKRNTRMAYDKHHAQLRNKVPPERLLIYRMGDGWEPLCRFLDKPVPEQEFPWINESKQLKKKTGKLLLGQLASAGYVVLRWFLAAAGIVYGTLWLLARARA